MPPSAAPSALLPVWARARPDGRGVVLTLHVQPGARVCAPAGRHGDALKLKIAAPAADNKANEALAAFLQRELGVARSGIRIAQGSRSRHKVIEIAAEPASLAPRLWVWDRGTGK